MVEKKREQITIFCDGSCWASHPNKHGGLGVYIQTEKKDYWISEGWSKTTISRMELRAILYAIRAIKIDVRTTITIYSDSQYSVNTIKEKGFDWRKGSLKGCDNYDLIDSIFKEIDLHKKTRIKLNWVPGHRKRYDDPIVVGNFIADQLADYKNHETYLEDISKEKQYLYSSEKAYYYHENSDSVFVAELLGPEFGQEKEFIQFIGECRERTLSELRKVCEENSFGWLMDLFDKDQLEINLKIE